MSNYNGYSNRETWATALHLSNDPGLYSAHKGQTKTMLQRDIEALEYYHIHGDHDGEPLLEGMFDDIGDLPKVNWQQVAEALK